MSLTDFKQKVSKANKLDVNSLKAAKGGLRLITRDTLMAFRKVAELSSSGKHYCYSQHNGEYCIEW